MGNGEGIGAMLQRRACATVQFRCVPRGGWEKMRVANDDTHTHTQALTHTNSAQLIYVFCVFRYALEHVGRRPSVASEQCSIFAFALMRHVRRGGTRMQNCRTRTVIIVRELLCVCALECSGACIKTLTSSVWPLRARAQNAPNVLGAPHIPHGGVAEFVGSGKGVSCVPHGFRCEIKYGFVADNNIDVFGGVGALGPRAVFCARD